MIEKRISPDEHYLILRRFVQAMLTGIFGGLLASGTDESFASNQTEYIALALNEPLNNPFKARRIEPVKYRLGAEHFRSFAALLRDNSHILLGILIAPPFEFTVEEAYYEWKWLVGQLDQTLPKLTSSEDRVRIARLLAIKAAWDRSVDVKVTVEIDGQIAKTVILDQRFDGETNAILAKRGLEQVVRSLTESSFKVQNPGDSKGKPSSSQRSQTHA